MTDGWNAWHAYGQRLDTGEGVHRPSEFSALLASTLADSAGLTVLDAGCGAGLISIAALEAGARHVIAMDRDPAALESTAANVRSLLGEDARARLSLWQADFSQLGALAADVLAVNPPQRPDSILGAVDSTERHLHTGAGADGLDTLRLVLANAAAREVRTTAAPALRLGEARFDGAWDAPELVAAETLPVHPAWGEPGDRAEVGVWTFRRSARSATNP
jgi:methylase of polypeptide subunit release factors